MLILSRNLRESIRIGDDVEVKIISVHDKKVRLGIDAPQDVAVHRQEIYDLILKSQKSKKEKKLA